MMAVHTERRGAVGVVEICHPPNNFFDVDLIKAAADAFDRFDADPAVRCTLLCSQGKNFCAGANFAGAPDGAQQLDARPLYVEALRLFRLDKPMVAAIQGGAIGGGLGLALAADFRVASTESRFAANFNRLGIHPGFGLTVTLPRAIGGQQAAMLFFTGKRITGAEAQAIGLVDILVDEADPRNAAHAFADEIALSAPLAVTATRRTLRHGLAEAVAEAVDRESRAQKIHFATADFREGVKAMSERRPPIFTGG
jgi:enoyl-CoA hydratase/carnithine racemase